MEEPTHKLKQSDLLRGMTSSLKNGACWGLSVRWLIECVSGGPSVAGLAMCVGTTAHEALHSHSEYANTFLTGLDDDVSIANCTVMLSAAKLDANRCNISSTGGHLNTAVSIIAALSNSRTFHGMIVITCREGRHAMAVTNTRNVWALYDPNFGTWVFAGDQQGAPVRFSHLIVDILNYYKVNDVKFYNIKSMLSG